MPIDFKHFAASASGRRVCQFLTKGRSTPEQFLVTILNTVNDIVPALQADTKYLTEDLCDPDVWPTWKIGEHRCAGMCLRYLSETGELPLEVVSPKGKYPLAFRLKATA